MNPIPLSAPDGTVYAYACGTCHLAHTGGWIAYAVPKPQPIDRHAEYARRKAERCCTCSTCGTPTPTSFLECPTCTADWRRRLHWREFCDAWCPIAAECSAPCGPGADGLVRYVESVNVAAARVDSQRQEQDR